MSQKLWLIIYGSLVIIDKKIQRMVFSTITGKMSISEDVDLEDLISRPDKLR